MRSWLVHLMASSCVPTACAACLANAAVCLQEDPFNAIMAGALTGGFLQLRSGLRPAFRSAVFGGALLVSGLAARTSVCFLCAFCVIYCVVCEQSPEHLLLHALWWNKQRNRSRHLRVSCA
jgi:hypothetical protein